VIGEPGRGGGRLIAMRRTAAVPGVVLMIIPGMGRLFVNKCDGTVGQVRFITAGTGPVDIMYSGLASNSLGAYAPGDNYAVITNDWLFPSSSANFGATLLGAYTINIARNTLNSTQIVAPTERLAPTVTRRSSSYRRRGCSPTGWCGTARAGTGHPRG
jgi:hypothetical protein